VLVENFLHGQGDDDFVAAFEEGFNLLQRVRRIIERHEETFLAIFAHHHGFKGVNVRAAGLVFLLDPDVKIAQPFMAGKQRNPFFKVPSGTADNGGRAQAPFVPDGTRNILEP
jgi:hypothetical protein